MHKYSSTATGGSAVIKTKRAGQNNTCRKCMCVADRWTGACASFKRGDGERVFISLAYARAVKCWGASSIILIFPSFCLHPYIHSRASILCNMLFVELFDCRAQAFQQLHQVAHERGTQF